jgi:hypothetical protein
MRKLLRKSAPTLGKLSTTPHIVPFKPASDANGDNMLEPHVSMPGFKEQKLTKKDAVPVEHTA